MFIRVNKIYWQGTWQGVLNMLYFSIELRVAGYPMKPAGVKNKGGIKQGYSFPREGILMDYAQKENFQEDNQRQAIHILDPGFISF